MTYTTRRNPDAHCLTVECDICEQTIAVDPANPDVVIEQHEAESHTRQEGPGTSPTPDRPDGSVSPIERIAVDPRIERFYDQAAAHGMSPGDYAIHLLGLPAILDVVELERQEGDES